MGLERQLGKLFAAPLAPGLYIVSTPIGNLGDISVRALSVLASADAVFCEDTRHSRKLLSAYGIGRKLEAYHDFSKEHDRARIVAALGQGKSVALISDARHASGRGPRFQAGARGDRGGNRRFCDPRPLGPSCGARDCRLADGPVLFRRIPASQGSGQAA